MNILLRKLGIAQESIQRSHSPTEYSLAQALELRASKSCGEIIAIGEAVRFYCSLCSRRERSLRTLAGRAEATEGLCIAAHIDLRLLLELLYTEVNEDIIKVLATQVRITRC